jgi:hypothetical protein
VIRSNATSAFAAERQVVIRTGLKDGMASVRIIAVPPGEAPEEVRKAWVGLVLPLASGRSGTTSGRGFGVQTGPKIRLMRILASLVGRRNFDGYIVDARTAVDLLARNAPEAASWWRNNTPHLFRPGIGLGFREDVCELVDDEIFRAG